LSTPETEVPMIVLFSFANGVGAALIIVPMVVDFNVSAFIIEVAWPGISLVGVGSIFSTSKNGTDPGVRNESGKNKC
jgi:hypothetical protein